MNQAVCGLKIGVSGKDGFDKEGIFIVSVGPLLDRISQRIMRYWVRYTRACRYQNRSNARAAFHLHAYKFNWKSNICLTLEGCTKKFILSFNLIKKHLCACILHNVSIDTFTCSFSFLFSKLSQKHSSLAIWRLEEITEQGAVMHAGRSCYGALRTSVRHILVCHYFWSVIIFLRIIGR